jgi:transcription antitermination protein NusB
MQKYAPKFDIDTMNKVAILATGIGAVEMLFFSGEIPAKVSINESVEIAKVYGDDQSKKIVNGILNSFFQDLSNEKISDISESNDFILFTI